MSQQSFHYQDDQEPAPFLGNDTYMPDVTCSRCDSHRMILNLQRFRSGKEHIRATCATCGRFVKYLAQTPANLERTRQCRNPIMEPNDDESWCA